MGLNFKDSLKKNNKKRVQTNMENKKTSEKTTLELLTIDNLINEKKKTQHKKISRIDDDQNLKQDDDESLQAAVLSVAGYFWCFKKFPFFKQHTETREMK